MCVCVFVLRACVIVKMPLMHVLQMCILVDLIVCRADFASFYVALSYEFFCCDESCVIRHCVRHFVRHLDDVIFQEKSRSS